MVKICIWLINETLIGTTTPGQSKPRSNVDKGVLYIPQSTAISGSLVSLSGYLFGRGTKMQSAYSGH